MGSISSSPIRRVFSKGFVKSMSRLVWGVLCRPTVSLRVPSIRVLNCSITLYYSVLRRHVCLYLRVDIYCNTNRYRFRQTIANLYFLYVEGLYRLVCFVCSSYRRTTSLFISNCACIRTMAVFLLYGWRLYHVCSRVSTDAISVSSFVGQHMVPTSHDFSSRGSSTSTEGQQRVSSCLNAYYPFSQ